MGWKEWPSWLKGGVIGTQQINQNISGNIKK